MYVDTHCHLNFNAFKEDWRAVADASDAAGVAKMIVVGADIETSRRAVELAQLHPALYASVGVHPHHARQFSISNYQFSINELMIQLKQLAKQPRVVAIGEIGLDYHVPKKSKYPEDLLPITEALKDTQLNLFKAQVKLAQELHLPMILHGREAKEAVLENLPAGARGVFHCFAGSKQYLKRVIAAGFYVGFDGDITYEPGKALVAQTATLDHLLLETDCPWLTPVPLRGQRNTPANLKYIAQKHADLRGVTLADIANQTSQNVKLLFRI